MPRTPKVPLRQGIDVKAARSRAASGAAPARRAAPPSSSRRPEAPPAPPPAEIQLARRKGPLPLEPNDPRALQYQEGERELAEEIIRRLESQQPEFAIGPDNPLRRLYVALTEEPNWGATLNTSKVRGTPDATESIWDYLNTVAYQGEAPQKALVKYLLNEGGYATKSELPSWWDRVPSDGLDSRVSRSLVEQFARKLNDPAAGEMGGELDRGNVWSPSSGAGVPGRAIPSVGMAGADRWVAPAEILDDPEASLDPRAINDPYTVAGPRDKDTPAAERLPPKSDAASRTLPPQVRELQQEGKLPADLGAWVGEPWRTGDPLDVQARRPANYEAIAEIQDWYARERDPVAVAGVIDALMTLSPIAHESAAQRIRAMAQGLGLKKTDAQLAELDRQRRFPSLSSGSSPEAVPPPGQIDSGDEGPFNGSEQAEPAHENLSLAGRRATDDEGTAIGQSYLALFRGELAAGDPQAAAAVARLRDMYGNNENAFLEDVFSADKMARVVGFPAADRVLLPKQGARYNERAHRQFWDQSKALMSLPDSQSPLAQKLRESGVTVEDLRAAEQHQSLLKNLRRQSIRDDNSQRALQAGSPDQRYTEMVQKAASGSHSAIAQMLEPRKYETHGSPDTEVVEESFAADNRRLQPGGVNPTLKRLAADPRTVATRLAQRAQMPHLEAALTDQIADLYPPESFGGNEALLRGRSVNPQGLAAYNEAKAEAELLSMMDPEAAAEAELLSMTQRKPLGTPPQLMEGLTPQSDPRIRTWEPEPLDAPLPGQPATSDGVPVFGPRPPAASYQAPPLGPKTLLESQLADLVGLMKGNDPLPKELLRVSPDSNPKEAVEPYQFPAADRPPFPEQLIARSSPTPIDPSLVAGLGAASTPADRIRLYAQRGIRMPSSLLLNPGMESELSDFPDYLQQMIRARAEAVKRAAQTGSDEIEQVIP